MWSIVLMGLAGLLVGGALSFRQQKSPLWVQIVFYILAYSLMNLLAFASLPRSFHALRHSLRVVAARCPVARARADLRLHFTKATLHSASAASTPERARAADACIGGDAGGSCACAAARRAPCRPATVTCLRTPPFVLRR